MPVTPGDQFSRHELAGNLFVRDLPPSIENCVTAWVSGPVNLELVEVPRLGVSWTLLIRSQVDAARLMSQTNRRVGQKDAAAEQQWPNPAVLTRQPSGFQVAALVVVRWWCGPACLLPVDPTTVHGAPAESWVQCKEKEGRPV